MPPQEPKKKSVWGSMEEQIASIIQEYTNAAYDQGYKDGFEAGEKHAKEYPLA